MIRHTLSSVFAHSPVADHKNLMFTVADKAHLYAKYDAYS